MEKTYAFKPLYKTMGIITLIAGGIAAVLNFITGDPMAFMMLFLALVGFFQIRHYSKPYVLLEHGNVYIHASFLKTLTFNINEVESMEQKKNQLVFTLKNKSKKNIFLNFLTTEDKATIQEDFSALLEGGDISDTSLSRHLVE